MRGNEQRLQQGKFQLDIMSKKKKKTSRELIENGNKLPKEAVQALSS